MTLMSETRLVQEAWARAHLQQATLQRAQEQRHLASLTASLVRPQGPLPGPALKRCLRTPSGWHVLRLIYSGDTLRVQVARRADAPQGALIWARWRLLRVVVRGWLLYRRMPDRLHDLAAEEGEVVGASADTGRAC
jgi:hypothetical protein